MTKPHTWFFDPVLEHYICFPHRLDDGYCKGCGHWITAEDLQRVYTSEIPASILAGKTPAGAILATLDYLVNQKWEDYDA